MCPLSKKRGCKSRDTVLLKDYALVVIYIVFLTSCLYYTLTVPKEIDFPRYNMKCSRILLGKFHVVSGFPLHFMLYPGHLDRFFNSALRGISGDPASQFIQTLL